MTVHKKEEAGTVMSNMTWLFQVLRHSQDELAHARELWTRVCVLRRIVEEWIIDDAWFW